MRILCCILMMGVMMAYPTQTSNAAREAIRTWGIDVIPSLFPYMVLCRMLMAQLRNTRMPMKAAAVLIGLVGGSPSGASVLSTCASYERTERRTLYVLVALTGTISPMFMLSTVRTWVNDDVLTNALFAAHVSGAMLSALLVHHSFPMHKNDVVVMKSVSDESRIEPIASSVTSVLGIGGCIVFFSVISAGIQAMLPTLSVSIQATIHAFLEIAGGMKSLAELDCSRLFKGTLAAGFCGFSGMSMLTQNHLFLRNLNVRFHHVFLLSLLRASCSVLAMTVILAILN